MAVIHVSGFRKTYGSTVAVDDVSFNVNAGEILVSSETIETRALPRVPISRAGLLMPAEDLLNGQVWGRAPAVQSAPPPRGNGPVAPIRSRHHTAQMKVYEHNDPDSLIPRSHPWIDGESEPAHRYYDFRTSPELIRSSLEDMQEWSAYPATETFYRLLEWLNGSESVFESNDCAFSGAIANTSAQFSKRLQCSGRLMILYRDLALNTSPEQIHWLTNAAAHALRRTDQAFEWGAIGATIMRVRFTTLPGPPELQRGQQLMLSFWAWGDDALEVMTNLDRTFRNVTVALRKLSDEIRHSSPATTSDD